MASHPTNDNRTVRTVYRTITDGDLLQAGSKILIGVSGGPDSVALTHLLRRFAPRWSLSLGIAHLNHGIRGIEGDRDEGFVQGMATRLGVPCHIERLPRDALADSGDQGPEASARNHRYRFLQQTAFAEGYDRIALGHNADDNAELVMMRLIQGSGPGGLCGMKARRPAWGEYKNICIIRPLIEVQRSAIMAYLSEIESDFVVDSSNTNPRFLRNRVRHRLLPLLEEAYNPNMRASLLRLARILQDEERWLNELVDSQLNHRLVEVAGGIEMNVENFEAIPIAMQRRLLRAAVGRLRNHLRKIHFHHVETLRDHIINRKGSWGLDFPDQIRVLRSGRRIRLSLEPLPLREARHPQSNIPDYHYQLKRPETLAISETGWQLRLRVIKTGVKHAETGQFATIFDMDKMVFPITVRNFRRGDRISPYGMTGTQKVNKLFIDRKIPRLDRKKYPILLSEGKIIWVGGIRKSNHCIPDETTRTFVRAELVLV
jgi:tRNA(Ile)-lysidine synthase